MDVEVHHILADGQLVVTERTGIVICPTRNHRPRGASRSVRVVIEPALPIAEVP